MSDDARIATRCAGAATRRFAAIALLLAVGSAHGAVKSVNPKDQYTDPFGFDPDGIVQEGEVPGIGNDPGPTDIPLDMRGHSDVPDLPDSGDDGGANSSSNLGLLGGDFRAPGLTWEFVGSVDDYSGVDPLITFKDGAFPVVDSSSPVPSPGGLVALTLAAVAAGARRRR